MRSSIRIGIVLALTAAASTAAAAPPVFSPGPPTRPHFRAFADWAPLWWKWVLGTPASTNPVLDSTGANCAVNQPVPGVFFLAGSFGPNSVQRTCSVPVGTALLIPLLNNAYLAQLTDPPAQRTEAFIRSQVLCTEQSTSLLLEVDGVAQPNPKSLLERSSVFSVSLPVDNVYAVPPQLLSPAVDTGYYSFIEPLAPGPHTIHFTSTSACGGAQDITYTLNVQGTVGNPISCSGRQRLNLSGIDIRTNGVALTVSGNCSVRITNSVLWGGTAGIVIHDQGQVIVENTVLGGGKAVQADGHGHGELRNSAVLSPLAVTQFAVVSDSGGNIKY